MTAPETATPSPETEDNGDTWMFFWFDIHGNRGTAMVATTDSADAWRQFERDYPPKLFTAHRATFVPGLTYPED